MSNKERNEMKSNTNIDLASIPHPKDCYPVPAGATIPPYTPCWIVRKHGLIEWVPDGYPGETIVCSNAALYLTIYPIPASPTPDDSPIIINHCQLRGVSGAKPSGLAVWTVPNKWVLVDDDGCGWWLHASEITDWSPAIVTKTGHGIWDERDKRARINRHGERVEWLSFSDKWLIHAGNERSYGSLAAIWRTQGNGYLTGFWGEEGGEE